MIEERDIETFVIDDDKHDMRILQDRINKLGLDKICLFARIRELKEKLNPNVRVLVVDIRLNDIDVDEDNEGGFIENGAQLMNYTRRKNPGIYVIAMSGQASEDILIELINNKVDYFIKKGTGFGYIDELIRQIQIGKEKVALRDAILEYATQSTNRIENRRKNRDRNDTGPMD